jgi:nucleotidyltransferase/DNA polymerase involved in DNA repair
MGRVETLARDRFRTGSHPPGIIDRRKDVPRILALAWPALRMPGGAPAFEAVLDALDELSPRVERLADGVALLDVTGLGALFGDERRIAQRAMALADHSTGRALALRAGAGDNRWLASLAARCARSVPELSFGVVPPGAGRAYCADLPLDLLPADAATQRRFVLFGLTRMGELAALPRSAVGAQFGPIGERLQQLARGEDPRPILPRSRPARITSRLTFDPPLDEIGGIALALRRCSTRLCERLRTRGQAAGRAVLRLELEDGMPLCLELGFPEPSLEPDWIARLLLGRLEVELRDAKAPSRPVTEDEPRVVAIGLVLDRLGDAGGRQMPAFEPRLRRWQELRPHLEQITARFGNGRLWRARHDRPMASLPERRARLDEIGPQA